MGCFVLKIILRPQTDRVMISGLAREDCVSKKKLLYLTSAVIRETYHASTGRSFPVQHLSDAGEGTSVVAILSRFRDIAGDFW